MNWGEAIQPLGQYYSEVFHITSNLNTLLANVEITSINPHNQRLDFYYSVSKDLNIWSDWKPLYATTSNLFEGYDTSNLYIRYRVDIGTTVNEERPFFQSLVINLHAYHSIENIGDLKANPKLWIRKIKSDGDIKIVNHYTQQTITLTKLRNGEEVFVDCSKEEIVSSLQNIGVYRFDNHNDEWLELERGENLIYGYGDFDLDYRFSSPLLQD